MILFNINAKFSNFLLSQFSEELVQRVILDPRAVGPMNSVGRPWTLSWRLWSSAVAMVALLDFGDGKKQVFRWSGDLVVFLFVRGVWSFFGVILLLLLLFPFPADSLLSGSLPDCSAKVTESTSISSSRTSWSTAFSTSWILASFLAVAVGFFPGSFVVVFWAISSQGPSLEGLPLFLGISPFYGEFFWFVLF